MRLSKSFLIINLCWIVVLLALGLIGSLSVGWATVKELPTVISVALSLASLILALIAIVQTIVSSGSLSSSLSDISGAATNVLEVSRDLEVTSKLFGEKFSSFEGMPSTLDQMKLRLEELSESSQPTSAAEKQQAVSKISSEEFDATAAFNRSTNGAVAALYALLLAHRTKKAFQFIEITPGSVGSYRDGVISGIKLSGIMGIRQDDDRNFVVDDLGVLTEEVIMGWVEKKLKSKKPKVSLYMKNIMNLTEKFFGTDD